MEKQKRAYVYALITVLFWATIASAFKITLRYVDILHLLLYSSATSAVILFFILFFQDKTWLLKEYSRRDYLHSIMLGFINPFFYYIILLKAYSLLRAQEAQPLNQTWVIVLPLLSIILLKQKIRRISILAILTSFFGVYIISTQGDIFGFRFTDPFGVSLALFSSVIWALFWIYNLKDRRDEVAKLFLNFTFGFIYVLVTILLFSKILFPENPGPILPQTYGLLGAIYIGVFEMGIAFVLWLKALKLSQNTAQVSHLIYLVPFLSLIVIRFTVGETIMSSTIIGLAFIITGILLHQYISRPKVSSHKTELRI